MNTKEIIERMRKHHRLADDAPVGIMSPIGKELSVDRGNRLLKFVATTDDIDSDDEVVIPSGADTSYFFQNRNIFVDHQYDIRSFVGKLRSASPWPSARDFRGWWVKVYIMPLAGNPLADDILTMAESGGVGTSIGYTQIDASRPTKEEAERYGKGERKPRSILRKWGWFEQTITALPCNVKNQTGDVVYDESKMAVIDQLLTKGLIKRESAEAVGLRTKERRKIVCVAPALAKA